MNDPICPYTKLQQQTLLHLAADAIAFSLQTHKPLPVSIEKFDKILRLQQACFVTLRIEGRLRGCMGTLIAKRPLVEDVSANAHSAAALDPRFNPVTAAESNQLNIHLSILSETTPLKFQSQADLFNKIRPKIDGLVLRSGNRTGTLLPAVWENVPRVEDFWDHLLKKAGLPDHYWSDELTVSRYSTFSFGT